MRFLVRVLLIACCCAVPAAAAVPQGIFVGLAETPAGERDPAVSPDSALTWYRKNTLVVRGDSLFLTESFVVYQGGREYRVHRVADLETAYAGRLSADGDTMTVELTLLRCLHCPRELRQNPATGAYEEAVTRTRTVHLRVQGDVIVLDSVPYMKRG